MYKNVSNQYTIALILLFSSYFTSSAQTISVNPAISYASAAVKSDRSSDHPPSDALTPAKPAETDTSWKPVRRLWGYAFGDFYYNAHADASNRGGETNCNGVPTYRNAFQFRRIYLGYEHDINKKFTAEVLL